MISTNQSQSRVINRQIEQLQKRLEAWRKSHKSRSRLPVRLWNAAARIAGQCGLNKTAKALRLDYYDLKKRLEVTAVNHRRAASFIELSPATASLVPECLIELEARNGTKMRIHLKGMAVPDLNSLSSTFWRVKR
jgi:hypothetical protein